MMAKFLMLSKSTDRMDALLSQKPFWNMFSDPNALLACQELALEMLADVVGDVVAVRRAQGGEVAAAVTVFDFSHILSVTEKRVEYDLLGAGPVSVHELRQIHAKLRQKYRQQLQGKLDRIFQQQQQQTSDVTSTDQEQLQQQQMQSPPRVSSDGSNNNNPKLHEQVLKHATCIGAVATGFAGSVFSKIKASPVNFRKPMSSSSSDTEPAIRDGLVVGSTPVAGAAATETNDFATPPSPLSGAAASAVGAVAGATTTTPSSIDVAVEDFLNSTDDGDWVSADMQGATDRVSNFIIGSDDDEEEEDMFL
jgi:hypothetical protein